MLKELGVNHYRFSISWTRILPNGFANVTNKAAIKYYNNLIDELIANNITPFVTMYHWDLPQTLQELNGLLSDDMAEWFGNYARILFANFGDRVKHWMTFNEPQVYCYFGYGNGIHPPRIIMPGLGDYICVRNTLLAHARAWHIYNDEFRAIQKGEVGIVFVIDGVIASSQSADDLAALEDYKIFNVSIFTRLIFPTSVRHLWVGGLKFLVEPRRNLNSLE